MAEDTIGESSAMAEDTEISELLERQEFYQTEEKEKREIVITRESINP